MLLGIALTTAYNKKRSIEGIDNADQLLAQQQKWLSQLAKINDLETLKKSLLEFGGGHGAVNIKEGIEGCIGDTPLIKIKSLSEFTGCDILAKAEVGILAWIYLPWNVANVNNSSSTEPATVQKTESL